MSEQGTSVRADFDARCLQDPMYRDRGIGRFALAALQALVELGVDVTALISPVLPRGRVPEDLPVLERAGTAADGFDLLFAPSPMTHDVSPLVQLRRLIPVACAFVFDFIPARHPSIYLNSEVDQATYRARLSMLSHYDELWCISQETRAQAERLGLPGAKTKVVWPDPLDLRHSAPAHAGMRRNEILVSTGMEWRKRWLTAVRGASQAVADSSTLINVLGINEDDFFRSDAKFMPDLPFERIRPQAGLSDAQVTELYARQRACVVSTVDEGLSLPVIEALLAGCPVAFSDIPVHRELAGSGPFAFDPRDPWSVSESLQYVLANEVDVLELQRSVLVNHEHELLTSAVEALVAACARPARTESRPIGKTRIDRMRLAVVSPFQPSRSGVADFSQRMVNELMQHADITLCGPEAARHGLPSLSPVELALHQSEFDQVISVLGNSHFHLDSMRALEEIQCHALCHDVRMNELNYFLYGPDEAARIASQGAAAEVVLPGELASWFSQPDATRNLGYWRVAQQAKAMAFHSARIAARVSAETGNHSTIALRFPVFREPDAGRHAPFDRDRFLASQSVRPDTQVVGIFGGVDIRTKAADTVMEAVAYLQMWGLPTSLVLVGGCEPRLLQQLKSLARDMALQDFKITGPVSEADYQGWLKASDATAIVRNGQLLSLSGAALDTLAFGVPTVMSESLIKDCGHTPYTVQVADSFTGLLVAEALEAALAMDRNSGDIEAARREFVATHGMDSYAKDLLSWLSGGSTGWQIDP